MTHFPNDCAILAFMTDGERANLSFQLAKDIRGGIQHSWDAFEALSTSPSVQTFCAMESRYDEARLDMEEPLSAITFEPAQGSFDAHQTAAIISEAYERTNTFTQGIVEAYCLRKHLPIPEIDDTETIATIMGSVEGRYYQS